MNNKHTGDFICARRKELNLSQKDLAEKLNVTDKAVSKWETGRSAPNISILEPLAEVLGVTVAELLKGEKAEKESLNNTSNEIIVETIKKSKKKIILTVSVILSAVVVLACAYPAYHFFTSVNINDTAGIEEMANFSIVDGDEDMKIIKSEKIGYYYAFLMMQDNGNEVHLRFFRTDEVFKNRIVCCGGSSADIGEIGMYSFGMNYLNTNVIFGYNITKSEYRYNYKGATCVKPVEDDGIVLDVLIEYDSTFRHATLIYD